MKYPKVIYLNVKDDEGEDLKEYLWSEEGINKYDIKYVLDSSDKEGNNK